jgi:hypothetical protein
VIKKEYKTGDIVWIYGISLNNNRSYKGTVVKVLDLRDCGYSIPHYIVSIANATEPLLEIRTWETMSQDEHGPVGGIREVLTSETTWPTHKKMSQTGYAYDPEFKEVENVEKPKRKSRIKKKRPTQPS